MKEIKEKVAKVDNGLAAQVRKNTEKIEKMVANWKAFCAKHVGDDADGKIGSARTALVGLIAVASLAGFALAGEIENWDAGGGAGGVNEAAGVVTIDADALTIRTTVSLPAGGVSSAALTDKDELATLVTPSITTNANGGTNVVVFTITDIAGTAVTYPVAVRFYITDAIDGAVAAVAGDVAISGGLELQQVVDKAHYLITTTNGATSTVTATITDTPGGTNYINAIAPCGRITRVVSAFDVP